jgi:acyl-CoA synthetase (AMP-forming)/AMP-acid ligase II
MHGTALWFALPALGQGGCVVTVPDRSFRAASLLDTVVREGVKGLCIVGDAFGRPLVEALDAEPGRWDLSGLRLIFSSGVLFSASVKERLLAAAPGATLVDSIGTSESGGVARAQARPGEEPGAPTFKVGPHTKVVAEDGTEVRPGSGERGRLAVGGSIPIGYYGDPVKTAETFVVIDGVTHVVAGDWCTVDDDGSIRFLGRGSVCINSGGEKVYPEEVEEVVKRIPGVRDAVLLGVPDERFGEAVTAVVERSDGASVGSEDVRAAVRGSLAGYKVPRHVVFADVVRQANGKLDYPALRELVGEALSS